MTKSVLRLLSAASVLFTLAACGGGGGGGFSPPPTSGWQPGVFLAASTFQNRCAVPRTGPDPTNGNQPYPDIQGTTTDENNFLRSFTNNTYLWYDEITDRDPATFPNTQDYFDQLKTFGTTPTGTPKDQFSFYFDTQEWFDLFQGGVSAGYGANFAVISATPPREVIVVYTEPNSPATNAPMPLLRGTKILSVDGTDINTTTQAGVDILNEGLFPSVLGVPHTFVVQDVGETGSHSVTLTSATITDAMVQNTKAITTPGGDRVGYMTFNYHRAPAEAELVTAINTLRGGAGIDDLVLDIRYNGGGFGDIANQLAYMIAGASNTAGKTFDLLQFNSKHPSTNPITGQPLAPDAFHNQTLEFSLAAGTALPTLDLARVFVITGPGTCSASELIINGLRGADIQVIQIGSTTCGKPYGFYEEPNCGTSYFPIQFRSVNDKNFGDYTDGFVPSAVDDAMANVLGCSVPDDYTKQLGDAAENRLEVALAYQAGLGCITPVSVGPRVLGKPGFTLDAVDAVLYRSPFDSNIVMRRPR
ncbi:MAG: S41 family peptidase [Proteobacteria bacterium]|nr:S41 family peptidase [Pseudomonadota bacterium]